MRSIPLMSPNITEDDIAAAVAVLRSGALVQGSNVEALENAIGEYIGVKHVIAVSSGTAALHLALIVLGIGVGDEVIVPAFSFVATANVVEIVGATPVFADIERDSFNIDVSQVQQAITPRTRAVIPVHEFGLCCDISGIVEIATRHGLFVIEDAACALGATENGKFAGAFGDMGSFSLHPRKAITSGEGGLVATDNNELAANLRTLRNHGITVQNGKAEFVAAGLNHRLTDFQAALALSQFRRFAENIAKRSSLTQIYASELGGADGIILPHAPENKLHTWQTYHVTLDEKFRRDDLIEDLRCKGIGTNYGAQCIPAQVFYQKKYGLDCEQLFPNSMNAYTHGLALPIYEKIDDEDVRFVARTLRNCLEARER